MDAVRSEAPAGWARALYAFATYMTQDLFGGPKNYKTSWAINTHKILTPIVVLSLMLAYDNFSTPAWLYLGLHGSYCVNWLIKHLAFRDPKWEIGVTLGGALFTFLLLALYWIAPFLLISGLLYREPREVPPWLMALTIVLLATGTTLMMTSDCQKRFTLRYRPGLITDGMFARIRHPNYLGEMMVYSSFALVVGLLLPWLVLAFFWICVFLVNIQMIESSISRYPEWPSYKARTGTLWPKFLGRSG